MANHNTPQKNSFLHPSSLFEIHGIEPSIQYFQPRMVKYIYIYEKKTLLKYWIN